MFADDTWLLSRMIFLIPLLLSLTVHEWAHAWSAWLLGDQMAEREGRLTLNPLAHIDPVGSLLLPVLGVPFGWAKPVPVNPGGFRPGVSLRTGVLITAAAGPISNICIALVCAMLLAVGVAWGGTAGVVPDAILDLLETFIYLNVILAVFNALPLPPLDGSRVVDCLVPDSLRPVWDAVCQYGMVLLILVLLLPLFVGINTLGWVIELTQCGIDWIVYSMAG